MALDRSGKASPNMSNNEQNEPEHHINVGPGRKTPHKPDQVLPGMWNLCHESMAERSRLHGIKNRNQNRKRQLRDPGASDPVVNFGNARPSRAICPPAGALTQLVMQSDGERPQNQQPAPLH